MAMILPALLIGQPAATATPSECFVDGALGVAPGNPPLLLDLPPSRNVEGGVLVALERARDTAWRMQCYQRWPQACQIVLDEQAAVASVALAEQKRVTAEVAALRIEEPSDHWPGWIVAIIAGGAGAGVGLAAGLVVGYLGGAR